MADQNIGQLSIGVNINSSNLNRSLEQMQRDLRLANQQFRTASAGVDRFSDSTDSLENKASALRTVIQQQEDVMQALAREYQRVAAAQGENSVQAQRLQTQYLQAQTRLANYNTQLRNTERQISNFGNSTNDATSQTQQFEQELNTAPGAASKLGAALKTLAAALVAAFAVDKIKDFTVQLVEASADIQALQSQYTQVMGGMQGETDKYLNEMSSKWNKHPNELKSALMQYMAILKGKGLSEKDAFETAKKYMDLTVDGNAFANEKMEDSTARLMGVIKGEYDSADTVMINFSQTLLNDKSVEVYGKKWEELNVTQQETLKTQEAIRQQTSAGVVGQGEREANSYANNLAMVNQTWLQIKATLGAPFLEVANGKLRQLAAILQNIDANAIAQKFATIIKAVSFEDVKAKVVELQTYIDQTFGFWIEQTMLQIVDFKNTLITSWGEITTAFANSGMNVANTRQALEDFINKIIEISGQLIDKVRQIIVFITPAIASIVSFIGSQMQMIKKFWDENGEGIMYGVSFMVQFLTNLFEKMFRILQPIIEVGWGVIKTAITFALTFILNAVKLFSAIFAGDWNAVSKAMQAIIQNAVDSAIKIFKLLWNGIKGILKGLKENIEDTFRGMSLSDIGENIMLGLKKGLEAGLKAVKNVISGLADDIPEWLKKKLG